MKSERVTLPDTLAAIWRLGSGSDPVTATEVADELSLTRRTAYNKLEQLAEQGDIQSKKVGANSRVWWIDTDPPSRQTPRSDRNQESTLEEAINRITNGFYALDPDLRFAYLNAPAKDLLDLDTSAIGADIREELYLTETFETALHEAIESGGPVFVEDYYEPLEAWFANAIYASDTGVTVYFREITNRKERERELERIERQFEATFNNPSAFIGLLNPDGTVRRINDTASEFIGVDEAAMRGEPFWETPWFPDDTDAQAKVRHKLERVANGEYVRTEFTHESPDGDVLVIDSRLEPVRNDDGDVIGILASGTDITERKRRERNLEESERRFRAFVENFPNGAVALVDPDLTYRTVGGNPQAVADVHTDEVEGRSVREAIPAPLADALAPRYEAALGGEASMFEAEYDSRTFEFQVVPVRDDEGEVFAALGMSWEITERKEYRRQLEESEHRYRMLAENFPNGSVGLFDEDLRYTAVGGELLDTLDIDPEAHVGERLADLHPPDRFEEIEPHFRAALDGETSEFEIEYGDRRLSAQTVPIRNADGEVTAGMLVVQDITEREERERELENRVDQQRVLAEFSQYALEDRSLDDIFDEAVTLVADVLDHDYCKVLELLPEDEELLLRNGVGWRDGIVGEATVADDRGSQAGYTLIAEEPVVVEDLDSETRFSGPELLTSHDVQGGISTVIGSYDEPWGILGTHDTEARSYADHDVQFVQSMANILTTAIRQRNREQELAEQNERLESFASMLAHELRNPVTIGQIYGQQLPTTDAPEAAEYVREAFDRIEAMIDVMLVLTRGRDALKQGSRVELAAVAEEAWAEAQTHEATLDLAVDTEIEADETYLRHLFRNLFENSVEHGRRNVAVTVGELPTGFYVADDGGGIPAEDRDAVFEAGYTTAADTGGSGLGLAFVKELANVYGWECTVTESDTGGAQFDFRGVK